MSAARRLALGVTALPALTLAAALAALAADVAAVRALDPEAVVARTRDGLDRPGRAPAYRLDAPATDSPADVLLLGASSLAMDRGQLSRALPERLRAEGVEATVYNLAWSGMTSTALRARLTEGLRVLEEGGVRPEVLVVYAGHNDVTYPFLQAWHEVLGTRWTIGGLYALAQLGLGDRFAASGDLAWFQRVRLPPLLDLTHDLGLATVDADGLQPALDAAQARFTRNLDALVTEAQGAGLRVVAVVPVGNLHWRPYGDPEVRALWTRAQAATGAEAHALRVAARERETLTADLRCKQRGQDTVRALAAKGVAVVDLQAVQDADPERLGPNAFQDYLHFNDSGFDVLIDALAPAVAAALTPPP